MLNLTEYVKLFSLDMFISAITRTKWRQSVLIFTITLAVIIADQITKLMVRSNMELGESIPSDGRFRLTYTTNSGGVFGLDIDSTFLLIMAPLVILIIIGLYFFYLPGENRLMRTGLGLLLGGAIGNLVDRVRLGKVTDFIDVRLWGDFHWATFNIADAAVTVSLFLLIFYFLQRARAYE
ncbi:MAG: signal peptidase II [Dehalococcoidia bacterium]